MTLCLASTSPIRRQLLSAVGVEHVARAPSFDEDRAKDGHRGDAPALAVSLARGKALSLAHDDWVLGADSVVEVDGRRFSKPASREEAADHLRFFAGRTLFLSSAAVLARDGAADWHHVETARLAVRAYDERFIAAYLDAEWPQVAYCVGVFRMEARGPTLFDRVEGSHFTILGLPLLPLLSALRERGLVS